MSTLAEVKNELFYCVCSYLSSQGAHLLAFNGTWGVTPEGLLSPVIVVEHLKCLSLCSKWLWVIVLKLQT